MEKAATFGSGVVRGGLYLLDEDIDHALLSSNPLNEEGGWIRLLFIPRDI